MARPQVYANAAAKQAAYRSRKKLAEYKRIREERDERARKCKHRTAYQLRFDDDNDAYKGTCGDCGATLTIVPKGVYAQLSF